MSRVPIKNFKKINYIVSTPRHEKKVTQRDTSAGLGGILKQVFFTRIESDKKNSQKETKSQGVKVYLPYVIYMFFPIFLISYDFFLKYIKKTIKVRTGAYRCTLKLLFHQGNNLSYLYLAFNNIYINKAQFVLQ